VKVERICIYAKELAESPNGDFIGFVGKIHLQGEELCLVPLMESGEKNRVVKRAVCMCYRLGREMHKKSLRKR
jgi:hypothetical protein